MMVGNSLYISITAGYVVATMLFSSARFLRSRKGRPTAFELAQFCLVVLLGLLVAAADFSMIVLNHTGSPALRSLLTNAQTPLLLAVGGLILLNLARLLWVFVRRAPMAPGGR